MLFTVLNGKSEQETALLILLKVIIGNIFYLFKEVYTLYALIYIYILKGIEDILVYYIYRVRIG